MSDLYNYVEGGYWDSGYVEILTSITGEIQTLTPSAIIELYEIDATVVGGSIYRFHSGLNELLGDIVWQGNTYSAFPIQASDFEWSGKGQMPRPKVLVSNALGTVTSLVLAYQDLIGCKFTRIRTLSKYLDAVNFPTRRNLLTYSEQLENAAWIKSGSGVGTAPVVTANSAIAPDGTNTAELVSLVNTGTTSSDWSWLYQNFVPSAGVTYTFSAWVKAATAGDVGKIVRLVGVITTPVTLTSDWRRVSVTGTTVGTSTISSGVRIRGTETTNTAVALHMWGAQLEVGSTASDYQPIGASFSRNPYADPTAEFPRDIFYVDRKSNETNEFVEFELAASLDLAGVALPRRQIIQNYCPWEYRGPECGYTGTNYFDTNDSPVATLSQDVCGKRLSSCRCRFGQYGELPYGGFPAAGLLKT